MWRYLLLLIALSLQSGCTYNVRHTINNTIDRMSEHPYDVAPESPPKTVKSSSARSLSLKPDDNAVASKIEDSSAEKVQTDATANEWLESQPTAGLSEDSLTDNGLQTVGFNEPSDDPGNLNPSQRSLDVNIPPQLPGSEAMRIVLPKDVVTQGREIDRIYPELPPLPLEPTVLPGPEGRAYTLSDLQQLAAANSPQLRQAVADVEAAKGSLIQAKTYANPNSGWLFDPNNNNTAANTQGVFIDQVVRTAGKQKLGVAAAQKSLEVSELALKRARSDLATAVRNAYFTLLVDVETLVVTKSLAKFTDEIYRLQTGLLKGAIAAPYEPASLRAQAFTTRLAYKQAITSYMYDWKQLVATIGEHQMPLTEVAGQVDRLIPYYEYDQVLGYALKNHTDVLTALSGIKIAQYNLKLAQVTPIPDLEFRASWERDKSAQPFGTYSQFSVGGPLPIWDQNRGNIIAAQGNLARAVEESHRVEVTLTNNLAGAYANYQNNLIAIEYYRRYILPDLVRYYRGIHARRQVDPSSAFGDLVAAQQNLSNNVTSYLVVLQNTWTSAVGVADFLQTDDLFQMATPRPLPELPDFNRSWPCDHGTLRGNCEYHTSAKSRSSIISIVDSTLDNDVGVSTLSSPGTIRTVSSRNNKSKTRPQAPTIQSERDEAAMPGRQSPDDSPAAGVN